MTRSTSPRRRHERQAIYVPLLVSVMLVTSCNGRNTKNGPGNATGFVPQPAAARIKLLLVPQQADNWCWAASAQMIMGYYGVNVKQCDQANTEFTRHDCCPAANTQVPDPCNTGGWPEFDKYGFTSSRTYSTPLSWEDLESELANNRPVAFSWGWVRSPNTGHMMVAIGYIQDQQSRRVIINDPSPLGQGQTRTIPYDEYVSADDHRHWDDFYSIKKQ